MKSVPIRRIFGPYFPVFGLNIGKYGPEKPPYLDTFHAVYCEVFKNTYFEEYLGMAAPLRSTILTERRLRILLFRGEVMFRSRDVQVFVF